MEINNCPTCGGKVEFSPDDIALKCEKCAKIFPIELKPPKEKRRLAYALAENESGNEQWKESKRIFQCESCGAQIFLNKFDMASKCSYCNTTSLVPLEKLPGLKPDAVIPFKINKTKADEVFKGSIKKRMFLPNDFKKNLPNTVIGATYISSFSFGIDAFATYNGTRAVTRTVHTKDGVRTSTYYVPFSGSIQHNFANIVVESCDKIQQHQINSILPYNFKDCYDYNDDFITGYGVQYYDQTVTETIKKAENVVLKSLDSMIRRKHGSVHTLSINPRYSNHKYSYVLLPLYFINFKYKNKEYLNLMNGQTGTTSGKIPKSPVKITFFTLFIILICIGLPLLVVLLSL